MKKVKWTLDIGFAGDERSGTIELFDDATDEEIKESVFDSANSYISIDWEVEAKKV